VTPSLVVCLRHAEKPGDAYDPPKPLGEDGPGFDRYGNVSPHSLTLRGWERAYALGANDLCGRVPDGPVTIFVPDYPGIAEQHRSYQTVLPFSLRRNVDPEFPCGRDDEDGLCKSVEKAKGVVVVCWEHKRLAHLVATLLKKKPVHWPQTRVDLIWSLRPRTSGGWTKREVVQPPLWKPPRRLTH
jgi:hypothetical protein